MFDSSYCQQQADLCRLLAVEAADPRLSLEWLAMADDWHAAAMAAANDNQTAQRRLRR